MGNVLRPVLFAALSTAAVAWASPGRAHIATTPSQAGNETAEPSQATAEEVELDEKLGASVPLELTLRDENGKPVTLRELVDKPTLLTLIYFRCVDLCPRLLNGVAEVASRTRALPAKDFQLIAVSFDDRDTPQIAAQKRKSMLEGMSRTIPPSGWRFLTGTAQNTKALADAVGFKFKREGEDFVHPAAILFMSPRGVVTRYMYGVTFLPADVDMAVLEAAQEQARPTINKWLEFCYSYDPQGRRYVFSLTRVVATLTLIGAAAFVLVLGLKGRRPKPEAPEGA